MAQDREEECGTHLLCELGIRQEQWNAAAVRIVLPDFLPEAAVCENGLRQVLPEVSICQTASRGEDGAGRGASGW